MKRRVSLRIQLLCVIVVTVIAAVVITGVLMYSQINSVMQEQIRENLENVMRENSININHTLNYVYRAEKTLNTNSHFKNLLIANGADVIERSNRTLEIQNVLKSTYGLLVDENTNEYSMTFIVNSSLASAKYLTPFRGEIFTEKYSGIYSDKIVKNEKWYNDIIEKNVIPQSFASTNNKNYIYFANVIRDVSMYDGRVLGVVIVGVNFSRILDNITYMGAKNALRLAIVDRNGNVAATSNSGLDENNIKLLLSKQKEYDGNITMVSGLDYGIKLVALLDEKVANIRIQEMGNYLLLCLVLVLLAVIITSVIISDGITRPIKELSDAMKNINENRDIQIKTKLPYNSEVVSLYQSYNRMMFRISELLDEAKLSGMREEEMRMKMLQAQIKPHYLYNALDSISMVAMLHGENEISEMITVLSDSFRYSINDTDNLIELGDEINFIHNYVKFQEWRYEEKIVFETDISQEDIKFGIPKFIIQPIVENSIIHGMGCGSRSVHIRITAEKIKDKFVVYVIDDGVGCKTEELNCQLKFGLKNVNDRIKLKFGEGYGLKYSDTPGGGVTAKIILPLGSK